MQWDPGQYHQFSDYRLRPAIDLLSRIGLEAPQTIVDLGCGTGNVTRILQQRWPKAQITGVDSSNEMLETARHTPSITWQQVDITTWEPSEKLDLIFSNAVLHWIDDHPALLTRLLSYLAPSGVLAIQMPANFDAPSHTAMGEAAMAGPWKTALEPLLRFRPILSLAEYDLLLRQHCATRDLWETTYLHALEGENPVAEWTKGTALKPLLDTLVEPHKSDFEALYREKICSAYPKHVDGITLFPFKRIFIVAVKG